MSLHLIFDLCLFIAFVFIACWIVTLRRFVEMQMGVNGDLLDLINSGQERTKEAVALSGKIVGAMKKRWS